MSISAVGNADMEITLTVGNQSVWFEAEQLDAVVELLEEAVEQAEQLAQHRQRQDDARRESDYRYVRGY